MFIHQEAKSGLHNAALAAAYEETNCQLVKQPSVNGNQHAIHQPTDEPMKLNHFNF